MSDIGGELESMRATARRFGTAGETFDGRLNDLSTRMTEAAHRFVETAQRALQDTNVLTEQVDSEMTGLRQQGAATAWRGANRERFVADVSSFQGKLGEATTRMRTFVEQVKGQVAGPLQSDIDGFAGEVRASGASAREIASSFTTAVENQAGALDAAMNQGWSSGA